MFVHHQVQALSERGVKTVVISPNPVAWGIGRLHPRLKERARVPREDIRDGIPVKYPRVVVLPRRILFQHSDALFYLSLRRLLPELRAAGIQLVHAHQAMPDGAAARLIARDLGVPFLVTVHGLDVHRHLVDHGPVADKTRATLGAAAAVVAVSTRVATQLEHAVAAERLAVNHNGISIDHDVVPADDAWPGKQVVLSVSRLIASKGHADIMQALAIMRASGVQPLWVIVGEGPQRATLEARARALGLREHVHFLGQQPHARVLGLMARAELFVLPSWEEGFGLVYAEAMQQGTATVACAGEGPADFIEHGRSGFLVPAHDPHALADIMTPCLRSAGVRRRVGEAGRAAVADLTWQRNAERQLAIYSRVLEQAGCADHTRGDLHCLPEGLNPPSGSTPRSAGRNSRSQAPPYVPRETRSSESRQPRVAHVSVVHRPDDPRIFERECRSLADAGYAVSLLAPGAEEHETHGVRLVSLPRRPRATRWLSAGQLLAQLHRLRPDVVHVHDPELLTLFPLLRPLGPRLVYDMHEYVGQAVAGKHYIPASLRRPAAWGTLFAQRMLASLADGVVGVVPEQFEQLGARPRLRVLLPNYPRFARFSHAAPRTELAADDRLRLIYIGSLTRSRGVSLMLDVVRDAGEGVVLYLGGDFYDPVFAAEVSQRVAEELRGRVRLLGRIPPSEVPHYLASAEVVWVPSLPTGQYRRPTVATKLFEGMACGLAALVSDLPGRAPVVAGERCGVLVPPTVEGHLAGVRSLLAARSEIAAMGRRGREAVCGRYSWEVIEHRLVDFYAELRARRPA
jgi:glycosyltransferase involved in cell wall biosynthesis